MDDLAKATPYLCRSLYTVMDTIQHDWHDLSRLALSPADKERVIFSLKGCHNEIRDLLSRLGASDA